MINASDITQWSVNQPWATRDNVEQDLLLSQAICEIANDPLLCNELVIRGGTAFHKLFLQKPYRYSEDLDYVRSRESKGTVHLLLNMGGEWPKVAFRPYLRNDYGGRRLPLRGAAHAECRPYVHILNVTRSAGSIMRTRIVATSLRMMLASGSGSGSGSASGSAPRA